MTTKLVGYATLTGDAHIGHFRFLQAAKARCDFLIVGLTTDETAAKQKRIPTLSYEHREAIFANCRFVDSLVPHNGESKPEAWRRLQFDICFTCAEEWLDSKEFDLLREKCPKVIIIGIPRYPNISSTMILQKVQQRFLENMIVISNGITGPIIRLENFVIKTINFSKEDLICSTRDNFGFFNSERIKEGLPRNYKHLEQQVEYPFIAGISAGREIVINHYFKDRDWSVFVSCCEPTYGSKEKSILISTSSLLDFAKQVQKARKFAATSTCLIMKYGGQTLHSIAASLTGMQLASICNRVLDIITELRATNTIHGDLHPNNILVNETTLDVKIIDWGWASSQIFQLCREEQTWLSNQLEANWDKQHFLGSVYNDSALNHISWPHVNQ